MAKKAVKKNAKESSPEVEDDEYEVEKILDHLRKKEGKKSVLTYRVKWKGYDEEGESTWEPEANVVETASAAVERYWKGVPKSKRKDRYAPGSKEYKALTEGSDAEEDAKPKRAGRRSRGAEEESDEEDKPAKKRGRKSGASAASVSPKKANGTTAAKKGRKSKASAASDDEEEEEPKQKKKPSSRAAAKKASKKAATPEPEEEDEVMQDGEEEEEEEEEAEVEEEMTNHVDWKEYYADEENWEDLITSVNTVDENPHDEDLSAFKTVPSQKAVRMLVVWQRGTAAYRKKKAAPAPAAAPALATPAASPAKKPEEAGKKKAASPEPAATTGEDKVEAIVADAQANAEPAPAEAAKERTAGEGEGESSSTGAAAAGEEGEEGDKEKEAEKKDADASAPTTGEDKVVSIVGAAEEDAEPNPAEAAKERHEGEGAANGAAPLVNGAAPAEAEEEAEYDDDREISSWVPGEIVRLRAPQKCLDFYESHLKFRQTGQAA